MMKSIQWFFDQLWKGDLLSWLVLIVLIICIGMAMRYYKAFMKKHGHYFQYAFLAMMVLCLYAFYAHPQQSTEFFQNIGEKAQAFWEKFKEM